MTFRRRLLALSLAAGCAGANRSSPEAPASAEPRAAEEAPGGALVPGRMIVRNASLDLTREDPEQGPVLAAALVKATGGWVSQSTTTALTARVPAPRLDQFLADAAALGALESRRLSGDDVTDQFRDSTVRRDNLEKIRARYLDLLAKAQSVSDAVTVEHELERITLELERLKGHLQALEQTAQYAQVTLSFGRKTRPGPVGWVFYGLAKGIKWLFVWD